MSCSPPICSWRAEAVVEGLSVDERAWLGAMALEAGRTPLGGSCPSCPRTSIGEPVCGGPPTSPPCCRPPTSRALRHGDHERSKGPSAPSPSGLTPKWVASTYRVLLNTHRVLAWLIPTHRVPSEQQTHTHTHRHTQCALISVQRMVHMDCDLLSVNRWSQRGSMEGGALGASTRALCTSGRSSMGAG